MEIKPVNISQKFSLFSDYWNPRIVGELNGQQVKLVRLQGEFVMHKHDEEDELFLVIEGVLKMELEQETLVIHAGEFVIIPKGVNHKPVAEQEVKVLLFEPAGTLNTGNTENQFTVRDLNEI